MKISKQYSRKILFASLCIILFIGFKIWNYFAPLPAHNWNKKEISRIKVADPEDFTFAVFGDNRGTPPVFESLLHNIGHDAEIAFAIDIGDLVNNEDSVHYRRFLNEVQENVAMPFLTVIGNHDRLFGSGNYQAIFGPTYYSFQIGQTYFIVLDATSKSVFDKSELNWLKAELLRAQDSKVRFVFMHVPPFDTTNIGFPGRSIQGKDGKYLLGLFRHYKVSHIFASHIHGYFSGMSKGVSYTITGGAGARLHGSDPEHFFHHYVTVRVQNGKVDTVIRHVPARGGIAYYFDTLKDYVF
jgi:hypothetical protein